MTIADREANPEIIAAQELEEAARFLDLEPWIAQRLHQPEKELHFNLQIKTDDAGPLMLHGMRVQHSFARGPCMGRLVMAKGQGTADARAEAMKQTWEWALWGLPLGGSSGLIQADVGELSERELREVVRAFVAVSSGVTGPDQDVITPSRDLPDQVMAWALSAKGSGDSKNLGAVTGKPLSLYGVDRERIAVMFLVDLLREVARSRETELAGKQVILVGFDIHARNVAAQLERLGARVIAIADSSGAVHHHTGLNIAMLTQHVGREGMIYGYAEAEQVKFDQMIRMPCDLLVLADGEQLQLTPDADMVVEMAGHLGEGIATRSFVVPEAVAGFGLHLADVLEWRKATWGLCAELDIPRVIRSVVKKTWRETFDYAQHHELSLGSAATTLAISRVAEAMRAL